jgi:hypothetical protein
MEFALLFAAVVILVVGYIAYTKNQEAVALKAKIAAKDVAVREIVTDLDVHLKEAQTFATEQDNIATNAERERDEALKLAQVKREERDLALSLARNKRDKINLV